MLVLPLLGWAMISAAGDPVMLGASLQLPSIVPADALVLDDNLFVTTLL